MAEEISIKVTIDESGAVKGLDDLKKMLDDLKKKSGKTGEESGSALSEGFKEHGAGVKGLLNDLTGGLANMFEDTLDSVKFLGAGIKGLKTAIVASGIGVLLVAAGTLVAYWDDLKEAMSGVSVEMENTAKAAEEAVAASEKELNNVSETENILKLQGKSELDILKIKQEKAKVEISALEAQLASQKTIKAAQVESAKRNKDILVGILEFTFAPLKAIAKAVDYIGEKLGKNWGLADKVQGLTESTANLVLNPEEKASEADATIAEIEKKLTQLKNQEAGFQLQINQIRKEAANKRAEEQAKADAEEKTRKEKLAQEEEQRQKEAAQRAAEYAKFKRDAEQQRLDEVEALQEEAYQAGLTQQEKELRALQDFYFEKIELARQAGIDTTALEKEYADKVAAIEQQKLDDQKAKRQKAKETEVQLASDTIGSLIALNEAFGTKDGKMSRAAFERNKKLQIAQALVQTYQAATAAFASAAANPITVGFPAFPFIQAGIATALGLANVKKIASTTYDGGGTGSASSPTPSTGGGFNSPNPQPNVNLPKLDQKPQDPMKAYVIQSDITRQGEAQQVIKRQTELGG